MDGNRTNRGSFTFDLIRHPFRVLRIDPSASNQQVQEALGIAREQRLASEDDLTGARDAILDPVRRLAFELKYPIDSPPADIEPLFTILSADASVDELLRVAERLAPLSKANFIAHAAARQPAVCALICAIIEAHASTDPKEIYEILKALRRTAGWTAPSVVDVSQGLQDLLTTHAQAVIDGFGTAREASEPLLAAVRQILALDARFHISVLESFAAAYRRSVRADATEKLEQIEASCEALRQQPTNASLLEELADALFGWAALCGPLILLDQYQNFGEKDFQIPADLVRALIADLTIDHHFDVALTLTDLSREVFNSMPATVVVLNKYRQIIERLSLTARLRPLHDFIDGLHEDIGAFNHALKEGGFWQNAAEPARGLWEIFDKTVKTVEQSVEPWMLIRDLALHLRRNVGDNAAASALLVGLIHYGEDFSATPSILEALRAELLPVRPKSSGESNLAKISRKTLIVLASVALVVMLGASVLYLDRDWTRVVWLNTSSRSPAAKVSTAADEEIMPAVGRGQHYSLGNVRYCHFQQERLRVMKQEVDGPEEVRAFNLLVVDYNSRCADFFYRDSDVAVVDAQLSANRERLAAEARQIMATWPGHTPGHVSAQPTK
jgi:hypothetical protein